VSASGRALEQVKKRTDMKHYDYMKGYKATDKDMKCQGFQFKIGEWYKHDGEVKLCKSGFHFCPQPSGPWAYYNGDGTRMFEVEARDVYEQWEPGADLKVVCSEIRIIKEIHPDGNSNTGYWNTGYRNTGDWNTGYRNTGDRNTGDWNTGNSNTGNSNTGNRNTGDWNACNYSAGFFCQKDPSIMCFDVNTKLTRDAFLEKHPSYYRLGELLNQDEPFDYSQFKDLPGWTLKKCKALHEKMKAGRKQRSSD